MSKTELINKFYPYAKGISEKYGVPVAVSLGMLILEVGWSLKTVGTHNYFNMKAPASYTGSVSIRVVDEFINGVWVKQTSRFVNFNSIDDCFDSFAQRLKRLWAGAFQHSDPVKFVSALVSGPVKYATDPKYIEKFKSVLKTLIGVDVDLFSNEILIGVALLILVPMVF